MQNFNYHQHTYRCGHADLDLSDEDYIKEYLRNGVKKVAFTDHCPEKEVIDPKERVRMRYDDRLEYLDSINNLKKKYNDKIDILSGYEIEYAPGQEENLQELKDETDILILGQHFVFGENINDIRIIGWGESNTDEELLKYGEYVKTAIEKGFPDIIAHPDLFMLGRKTFGKLEEDVTRTICKTAEKYNIPLEINLNNIFCNTYYNYYTKEFLYDGIENQYSKLSNVHYPSKRFWEIVSEYDIKVLYGLDAHHKGAITCFKDLMILAKFIIGDETIGKLKFIENL